MITVNSGLQEATWRPERKLKFKFEVRWDDVNWVDESKYVKNVTGFEELQGELGQSTSSELDVTLWNENERFTPDNISSPLFGKLRLNKEARLAFGFADIFSGEPLLINKFYGLIDSIAPEESERTVGLHLFDKSKKFMDDKIRTQMFQDFRTDQLILTLASGIENETTSQNSGFKSPTVTGDIYNQWTNPDNAFASNNNRTTAGSVGLQQDYSTFGLVIPDNAVVDGIEVEVEFRSSSSPSDAIVGVELSGNGGLNYTTSLKNNTSTSGTDATFTYGSSNDIWGKFWKPTDFTDQKFRLRIKRETGSTVTPEVDHIQIKIYYHTFNKISLEVGQQHVSFAFFDDHVLWGRMQEIAEGEGGRIFYDYDTLTFWNRIHLNGLSPIQNLGWWWWLQSISQIINSADVKNIINVIARPRVVQAFQPIFTQESAQEFPPNKQLVFWVEFNDRDGSPMPVVSAVNPSGTNPDTTSYFRANTKEDGTGTNKTGQVELKGFDLFATSAKVRLAGPAGTFLTAFQVWGIPAKIVKTITEEQEDLESQRDFGKQRLTVDNDFIDSEDYARLLAEELLKRYKNQKSNFSIRTIGIPWLQPGDVVEVQLTENRIDIEPDNETFTLDIHSLDGDEQLAEGPPVVGSDYMINAIRYYIGPDAGFYQELSLINPYLP
jgi:hypothetical protein